MPVKVAVYDWQLFDDFTLDENSSETPPEPVFEFVKPGVAQGSIPSGTYGSADLTHLLESLGKDVLTEDEQFVLRELMLV